MKSSTKSKAGADRAVPKAESAGSKVAKKSKDGNALKRQKLQALLAAKRAKEVKEEKPSATAAKPAAIKTQATQPAPKLSALQQKMQQKLKGARFRWINEMLYTTTGNKAFDMVQKDPAIFEEYHRGFSSQVEKWPVNPIDVFIKYLRESSKRLVVADMGCGEAGIAAAVGNQHEIHSFDLVAHNEYITPCNIANVPMEKEKADVAIFSLALMGTDFLKFIREANRILRRGGQLKIAEVVSRIPDIDGFVKALEGQGFRSTHKDASNKMFIMLDFVKTKNPPASFNANSTLLKPCIYKRR